MTDSKGKILLVGAGQLGSRHLQGLARIAVPVSVEVVDPHPASLETARERFAEIESNPNVESVRFAGDLDAVGDDIDVAIVATASDVRADVVTSLLSKRKVANLILEKVLFQRESDYQRVGRLLRERQVNAVVNCPRRIYPFYRELKETLQRDEPVTLAVDGSNWGLACNAVHFLDLFAFLTGDHSVHLEDGSLDSSILESKRPGFLEFTGTLRGGNARGDRFEIASRPEPGLPLTVTVESAKGRVEISESAGKAAFYDPAAGTKRLDSFAVCYQSQLTGTVVQGLLEEGACGLTSFEESARLHLPILETFIRHLNRFGGREYDHCPIT